MLLLEERQVESVGINCVAASKWKVYVYTVPTNLFGMEGKGLAANVPE